MAWWGWEALLECVIVFTRMVYKQFILTANVCNATAVVQPSLPMPVLGKPFIMVARRARENLRVFTLYIGPNSALVKKKTPRPKGAGKFWPISRIWGVPRGGGGVSEKSRDAKS